MRKVNLLLLLAGFILASGCGNQTIIGNNRPALETEPAKEEIVIWHTYSEQETYVFENVIIPLFEEQHPLIKVKSVRQPYNVELKPALISRASANKPPDIIRMDIVWVPSFAQLGLLYPVSDFDDFDQLKDQFYEVPMQSNYYNGKYYGLPLNTNTKVSIYNKKQLEATGNNSPPETMDELIELIEKNQLEIAIESLRAWDFLHYFHGLGGQLIDPTNTKATGYLNSEQSIAAAHKLLTLFQNRNVVTAVGKKWNGVLEGKYFVIDEGPWFYSVNSSEQIHFINEVTVSAPFPMSNRKRAVLGGENLVISRGTKHKEAAWTFIKWMTSVVPQTYMAETGLIPTNKHVELSGFFDPYPYYQVYLDSLDDALLRPIVPHYWNIEEVYTKYFTLIFSEKISVEEGLTKAAEEIDKILANQEGKK